MAIRTLYDAVRGVASPRIFRSGRQPVRRWWYPVLIVLDNQSWYVPEAQAREAYDSTSWWQYEREACTRSPGSTAMRVVGGHRARPGLARWVLRARR